MRQRDPRERDDKHLQWVRGLPCLVCMNNIETEAAHVRMSDERAAKQNPGVGQKPHDYWVVPLCSNCHRHQHEVGEIAFWDMAAIDPIAVAPWLYLVSGDQQAGERIVRAQH